MVDPKSGKYDLLPHVAPGNIESFTGRLYDNVKLVGEENLISGKFVFNVGDIVYGKINPQLGKYVFARFSGLTSADAYVLNAKNGIVQKFLYAVIQTRDFYDYSVSVSKRSGMPKINRDELNAYSYWAPSESEQLKIGEYLLTLDHLITLHQRKCKIRNLRCPKSTAITWEQRKLGDCFAERVESMPDGELISVTINDGIKKFSELGRHDNSNDDKSKYKKVCIGDIAYNSMRMWQGASGYSPYEGIVSPAYTVLSPNSGINSKCLAYQFKLPEMIHTFQINSQGITSDNWNLKYPALSEIEIFVSRNEKEQAKIAEYFEWLDRLITLHQRKQKQKSPPITASLVIYGSICFDCFMSVSNTS